MAGKNTTTTAIGKCHILYIVIWVYTPMSSTCYVRCSGLHLSNNKLRENLYLLFSEYGEVIKITVQSGKDTLAWVAMSNEQEAQLASYSLNNSRFFNQVLSVQLSNKNTQNIV